MHSIVSAAEDTLHSVGRIEMGSARVAVPFFQAVLGSTLYGQKVKEGKMFPSSETSTECSRLIPTC